MFTVAPVHRYGKIEKDKADNETADQNRNIYVRFLGIHKVAKAKTRLVNKLI